MSATVRTFGKYLLDEEIARGGMSRVFSARLRGLGGFEKRLVVKQVLPELASDPRFVSMFVDEAKTLVQMSHPHIAPVYELGVVDGVYFLAMEYVEGATLAAILADGPLAPGLAAHLGAEICDALHYAHARFSIVHRDVTPRNVIVDSIGHCRLLDFGIAAAAGEGAEIFGTPGYLSPEQLEGGALGPSSDVFSLGSVLYEALTARRAFPGGTLAEARIAMGHTPSLDDDADVPRELASIVERALAPNERRYTSARELGRALRGWLASTFPEGVAAELGTRAERAEARVVRERGEGARVSAPTDKTGEVRTLATSRALDVILEREILEGDAAGGTVPIEGRKSAPSPISAGRAEDPETFAPPRAAPMSAAPTWLALGVAAAVAIVLGYLGVTYEPAAPHRDVPRAAVAPREERSAPPAPAPIAREEAPTVAEPVAEAPPAPVAVVAPSVVPAAITINASPWADVILDGRTIGRTPQRRVHVRPGRHTIVLRCAPLGRELEHTFEAASAQRFTIVADLTRDPPALRVR